MSGTLESSDQVRQSRRRVRTRRVLLVTSLLLILGGTFGVWLLKNALVGAVVARIPAEWEQSLGRAAFESVRGNFVRDAEAAELLEALVQPLIDTVGEGAPESFTFRIARDDAVNAFAAPGGYVVINTGLLQAADRPEQVLGVVAHEIAHVTQRHGLRAMVDSLSIRILLGLVSGGTDLPRELVDNSSRLLQLRHSRKQEREADDVGWEHLLRAGIDPRGLEEFFQVVQQEHPHEPFEFLSTHPASESRIEELRDRWKEVDAAKIKPVDPQLLTNLKKQLKLP